MRLSIVLAITCLCSPLSASAQSSSSIVICKKSSSGALTLRNRRCAARETKITNISTLQGATGPQGSDGALRIYGDGSSGALTVSSSATWSSTEALGQYTDCSVASGVTLTVPTGTVLRCSGSFTNDGTILISNPYVGPQIGGIAASGGILPNYEGASPAGLGWGRVAASSGGYGSNSATVTGGLGGFGLAVNFAANILRPGPIGGGAGGAPVGSYGVSGGGTLTVLANGPLVNNGTVRADGISASAGLGGGGAGGIIILASKTSFSNSVGGSIEADGGNGGASNSFRASSGGGGGGLIHILSPVINMVGTTSVVGGAAGDSSTNVTNTPRGGGAAGGSMVGAGGAGGSVATNNAVSGTTAGGDGAVIQTLTDPTSLF